MLLLTKGCDMTLTQGHIFKVKVTVCLHVKIFPWSQCFTALMDLDNISEECFSWPKSLSWLWPKVISLRSRPQCTKMLKHCPSHNILLHGWIWIIFLRNVTHDQSVCHDLGQGHVLQIPNAAFEHCCFSTLQLLGGRGYSSRSRTALV